MNNKLAHIFQHVPFEGIGSMAGWLKLNHYRTEFTRFFMEEQPPDMNGVDLLIIMGGPMSVNDEHNLTWIAKEKRAITKAIDRKIPIVGICLGAQLIASALGACVYPNHQKEIGWFSVRSEIIPHGCFAFPEEFVAFHWHGETFDLPVGAIHLASSKGCRHQAFQYKSNVIGLQFHLETTPESAEALVHNCRNELIPGTYVQTEELILHGNTSRYEHINQMMMNVLSYITREQPGAV